MAIDLARLSDAVRYEGGVSRRLILAYAGALSSLPGLALAQAPDGRPVFTSDPFTQGVASGDPDHRGFVIWTRLAPQPLEQNGGMPRQSVPVRWEVADDEGMTNIVQSGTANAAYLLGHSVHVEVEGLRPDRWYWYRFRTGEAVSAIGRSRTLPEPGSRPSQLRFAFVSCQDYQAGYYTAYKAIAQDDVDMVFHLGDYTYERAWRPDNKGPRRHIGPSPRTVGEYRAWHSLYRLDPLLQQAHARFPWFLTWDDHEVENNYAGPYSDRPDADPAEFLFQRANAYQVYYEQMPLRRRSTPRGPDMQLYRKASFGRLAEIFILDTRQYRTKQPYGGERHDISEDALDPNATIMGAAQRKWLEAGLAASPATWNVLAQQVMMAMIDLDAPGPDYMMDTWSGYGRDRMDLMAFIGSRKIANPVVLTGDIHYAYVNDVRVDDRKMDQPIVAAEFIGPSISSAGDVPDDPAAVQRKLTNNPFMHFHDRKRGYVRCTVTPKTWRADYMGVDSVQRPDGAVSQRAAFVVEAGRKGVQRA
jgi:alkaline phosphatase D